MLVPLSPPPGLNSDDSTFAAQGRWADGINVRFWNGKPQTRGGSEELFTISGRCRTIMPFIRSGAITTAYGVAGSGISANTSKLFVGSGIAAPIVCTPAGLSNNETGWALAAFGDILLAAPVGGTLYEQAGYSGATAVAGAPNAMNWMLVTNERQVLAFGCNEEASGDFNPHCIRGSDLENYAEWTSTASNNAFEHILDGASPIVAARQVGSNIAVWSVDALYMGQFIGDPSQTYRFDKVDIGCGLIGPNAVVVVGQTAYWMSPDKRIRSWAPGGAVQLVPCPISNAVANRYVDGSWGRYVTACYNPTFHEVRFDTRFSGGFPAYPIVSGGSDNNYFVAFSLLDGAWWKGTGGRTAMVCSGNLVPLTTSYSGNPAIIAADGNGVIYLEETGSIDYPIGQGSNVVAYVDSADQYFDESQGRVMIRSIAPDFESQDGNASVIFYVRSRPQDARRVKGPYLLEPTTTKKGVRVSGKLIAVRFAATEYANGNSSIPVSLSGAFRLGKPLFDIVPLGER
jgi:hypothetical protein